MHRPTIARTNVSAHKQYRFFVDSKGEDLSWHDVLNRFCDRTVFVPDTFSELIKICIWILFNNEISYWTCAWCMMTHLIAVLFLPRLRLSSGPSLFDKLSSALDIEGDPLSLQGSRKLAIINTGYLLISLKQAADK